MSGATDAVLARLQAEVEEKQIQMDGLIEGAQSEGRDIRPEEMALYQRHSERLKFLELQIQPLREGARIAADSSRRVSELQEQFAQARNPNAVPKHVEYRSAGGYIVDHWKAALGHEDARERLALYLRVAAHQTVTDNPGLIPEPIVGGVLDFIDAARPIVSALGVQAVPGARFTRPKVTQHTQVAVQSAEKAELSSRKMLITETAVTMATYGGYVNVSRQNIDWSVPQILDLVVNDLAGQYAIVTEQVTAAALETASTAQTPVITAASTAAEVNAAIWKAAGSAYTATQGIGGLILAVAPDMMGAIGPLFPSVNPTNANSSGFTAGSLGVGPMGTISGITVVMSAGLAAGTVLLISTAAAEVYEQRIGSLQVTEPSVLGVQVAYAGYFAPVVMQSTGIIRLDAA